MKLCAFLLRVNWKFFSCKFHKYFLNMKLFGLSNKELVVKLLAITNVITNCFHSCKFIKIILLS